MRRDLHVGSGISRHLHRLFASSPVINSPAVAVTLSPSYIRGIFSIHTTMIQIYVLRFISVEMEPPACVYLSFFFRQSIIRTTLLTTERISPPPFITQSLLSFVHSLSVYQKIPLLRCRIYLQFTMYRVNRKFITYMLTNVDISPESFEFRNVEDNF